MPCIKMHKFVGSTWFQTVVLSAPLLFKNQGTRTRAKKVESCPSRPNQTQKLKTQLL